MLSAAAALHDIWKGSSQDTCHDHGKEALNELPHLDKLLGVHHSVLKTIATVASIHDQGNVLSVPLHIKLFDEDIFCPRLALLFKLADMLDCTYHRLSIDRHQIGIENFDQKSQARHATVDWRLLRDPDNNVHIYITVDPVNKEDLEASFRAIKMLDNEFKQHENALYLLELPVSFIPRLSKTSSRDQSIVDHYNAIMSKTINIDMPEDYKYPIKKRAHVHLLFIRGATDRNNLLMKYNESWQQFLLPSVAMTFEFDDIEDIVAHCVTKRYGIQPSDLSLKKITGGFFALKSSKRDQILTEYNYRICLVDLQKPCHLTEDEFDYCGEKYKWISINDCVSIPAIYEGNTDVIYLLSKIFDVPFNPPDKIITPYSRDARLFKISNIDFG